MTVPVSALRAYGARHVTLCTSAGNFAGRILQDKLSDRAVMILLATDDDSAEPLVVPVESIETVVER